MADQFGIMDDPAAQQDALEIARRRAIAAALTQQSMTQEDPARTAGKYVVPFSPIQGLAKLAQAYAGAKINQRADTQETALQGRRLDYRKAMARSLLGADATPAQIAAAEAYPQQAAEYTLRKPDKPDAPSSDMQEYQTWEKQGGQGGIAGYMKFKAGLAPQARLEFHNPAQDDNPEDIETVAQAIASGSQAPISGARTPRAIKIMARVEKINPGYRGTDYGTGMAAEKYWTSGLGGRTVRALKAADSHLEVLGGLADALQNSDLPAINRLSNYWKTQTGQAAPGNFEAAKTFVSAELVKAIAGSEGSIEDRRQAHETVAAAKSPEQLRQVIQTYRQLMQGQFKASEDMYTAGTRKNDFRQRFQIGDVEHGGQPAAAPAAEAPLTPAEQAELNALKAKHGR